MFKSSGCQRILVAESQKSVSREVRDVLSQMGHQVVVASSLDQLMTHLSADCYDLLLLSDHLLEDEAAILLQKLNDEFPSVSVVLISSTPQLKSILSALRHRVVDYLVRPFHLNDLKSAVTRGLGQAEPLPTDQACCGGRQSGRTVDKTAVKPPAI